MDTVIPGISPTFVSSTGQREEIVNGAYYAEVLPIGSVRQHILAGFSPVYVNQIRLQQEILVGIYLNETEQTVYLSGPFPLAHPVKYALT